MSVDSLDTLKDALAGLFDDRTPPEGFLDGFVVLPINPDGALPEELLGGGDDSHALDTVRPRTRFPDIPGVSGEAFPGALQRVGQGDVLPPPDALAFYLPFHYFHPTWWGIYLVHEGVELLRGHLVRLSAGRLTPQQADLAARQFLYWHEYFHHEVECFSARLEITHRKPLYRTAFEAHYRRDAGTDDWTEETLANAHALRKTLSCFQKDAATKQLVRGALLDYIKASPPGYRLAGEFERTPAFRKERERFLEANHRVCFPNVPSVVGEVWRSAPFTTSGISRITSRVNYLIHRGHPLAGRAALSRPLLPREVVRILHEQVGAEVVRQRGSHIQMRTRDGRRVTVPAHPRDLAPGTLKSIFQQAGKPMSLSEIIQLR